MRRLLLRWLLLALSVMAASAVSSAIHLGFHVQLKSFSDFLVLLLGVAVLSFLNATVGRILKFLTFPISCITFGLFSLVINAFVLWFAAQFHFGFYISEGNSIGAFVAAFVASLIISFVNGVLGVFLPDSDKDS